MWPKEMFEWKRKPVSIREDELKKLIAEKNSKYLNDFLSDGVLPVDKPSESV
jgi:hypothetical protein